MSPQADYVVSNGTGAAVRSDINGQLAAIVSNNSGATAPSTTYAYQWWADTSTNLLKLRNGANSSFITVGDLTATNLGLAALASPTFTGTVTIPTATISTGAGIPLASAASPAIYFTGDTNTGIYSPGADQFAITTGGSGRVFVDSSGRVGLGTSSPSTLLHIQSTDPAFRFKRSDAGTDAYGELTTDTSGLVTMKCDPANAAAGSGFRITVDNSEALRVDSSGRLGIGTTSPNRTLTLYDSSTPIIQLINSSSGTTSGSGSQIYRSSTGFVIEEQGALPIQFLVNGGSERARIDSSGRLLVGTSTARSNLYNTTYSALFQVEAANSETLGRSSAFIYGDSNTSGPIIALGKHRGTSVGGNTVVQSGDECGRIIFQGSDGTEFVQAAVIAAEVDGTPGANDMPGRLVFSTTADGASSPTERMRIKNSGDIIFYSTSLIFPNTDNAAQLGGNSNRFTALFAVNGTIQTSDKREKTEVADSQLGVEFIKSLRPVSYKWIEGGNVDSGKRDENGNYIYESVPGKRTHWGFIAQEVKEAVDTAGVDFGGWVLTDKDDPDSQQALRYDQFIAPLTKALQEALQKIEDLEQRLTDAGIA